MEFFRVPKSVKAWALPLAFAAGALFVVAGCGPYATSGPATIATATPVPTPPPIPSSTPFAVATTQSIAVSATATPLVIVQPGAAGVTGSVTLPVTSVPPGTTVTTTVSSSPPPGAPAFAFARQTQSFREALSGSMTVINFPTITSSTSLIGTADPVFTETVPAGYPTTGVFYYYAYLDQNNVWEYGFAGPGVISGQTITMTGAYPLNFTANVPLQFAFFVQPSAAATPAPPTAPPATPSPSPSPSPSPTPTGAIGVGIH